MAMSDRALYCITIVIDAEGGYVNDPNDPGGETKFGISKAAYPNVDIQNLTIEQAQYYYQRDYWNPVLADKLPSPLDLYVFDAAVNQGVGRAIRILQEACKIPVDGYIGGQTLAAAAHLQPKMYLAQRVLHYVQDSDWDTEGKGWMMRLFNLCTR